MKIQGMATGGRSPFNCNQQKIGKGNSLYKLSLCLKYNELIYWMYQEYSDHVLYAIQTIEPMKTNYKIYVYDTIEE